MCRGKLSGKEVFAKLDEHYKKKNRPEVDIFQF